MQFDEMILEAARGIMAASSALVRAANAAQRELIDQGKVSRTPLHSSDDGQWSEGLISAARLVAAATHSLVESAQNLVQGVGTEEMLISSAKQVAASTAQLLIACKVKSDPNSETGRRLQAAGNAVIKSTDNLVRAAQRVIDIEEEHILKINTTLVDGMAQEINARSEVLKMEKQLDEARNKLTAIRQAKYRPKVHGDESDSGDGHHSQPLHQYPGSLMAGGQPQHYHIATAAAAAAASGTSSPLQQRNHHSAANTTPSSPSFLSASASTSFGVGSSPKRLGNSSVLTANAVPRPYHSTDTTGSSSSLPQSPVLQRVYQAGAPPVPPPPASFSIGSGLGRPVPPPPPSSGGGSKPSSPYLMQRAAADKTAQLRSANLDAYVSDLHQKTYGNATPPPLRSPAAGGPHGGTSTFRTTATTQVGGVDPRYEQYGLSPIGGSGGEHQNGSNFDTFSR